MSRKNLISIVVLVLAALTVVWWLRPPSEEERVAKRVASLAECLNKNAGETNTVMALKFNSLSGMFADSVAVDISELNFNGTYSSSEIPSLISRYRAMLDTLALAFHDLTVTLDGADRATATFTARAILRARNGQEQTETHEVHAQLHKVDDEWVFARFHEENVLVR